MNQNHESKTTVDSPGSKNKVVVLLLLDEIQKLNDTLQDIVRETEDKIKNEVNTLKIEYNFKYERLLKDLKITEEEIKSKSLEIEKYSTKCKLLENEIEKFQKGIFNIDDSRTSKLLVLEKNLESTFQKLVRIDTICYNFNKKVFLFYYLYYLLVSFRKTKYSACV